MQRRKPHREPFLLGLRFAARRWRAGSGRGAAAAAASGALTRGGLPRCTHSAERAVERDPAPLGRATRKEQHGLLPLPGGKSRRDAVLPVLRCPLAAPAGAEGAT